MLLSFQYNADGLTCLQVRGVLYLSRVREICGFAFLATGPTGFLVSSNGKVKQLLGCLVAGDLLMRKRSFLIILSISGFSTTFTTRDDATCFTSIQISSEEFGKHYTSYFLVLKAF